MRVDGEKSEKLTDGAGLHRPSRRRSRLLRRVAELGFFGRLQRNVRRNVLLMESDSDDDYDSSDEGVGEDDSDDEMRPRSSAWARRVGESERDELNDMLENLASARHWAMRMGAAEKKDTAAASTLKTGEEAATVSGDDEPTTSEPTTDASSSSPLITSESVSRVLYELGETGKAMFASPRRYHVANDAGSIFVDVRWVSCLRGLFLRIKVESGAHLLAMDAGDTSDPYVKVTFVTNAGLPIKGQVHRTGYRPKTLNPVWNESFYMGSDKLQINDCSLKFEVFDFDIMSADDAMGSATLPLSYFTHAQQTNAETVEKLVEAVSEDKTLTKSETKNTVHVEKVRGAHGASATTVMRFKDGYFTPKRSDEMMVHLKLQKPKETNYVYEEAQAMLGFAKQLLDPRNFGKSLGQTGVGTWLNSKIEQAVDVGKRRALKIIDTTIEDKKNKLSRLAVADRDMPTIIRNYIRNVLCMYIADIQQELMSDLSIRMKVLDSARVDDRSADGKSLFIARRRRKHRGVFGFIVDFLNGARCWYLYNEVPGDLSIFGKVRNPYWWIFLATKVYFGLGLQAFVFFVRLVLVDKRDEWQMFEYIMVFKGIQFVSGTISVFSGVLSFIRCAGVVDAGLPHTCHRSGPWIDEMNVCVFSKSVCVSLNVCSYLFRIVMCWYAFHRLRHSFAFGRAIASDHRLIGGTIVITTVTSGSRFKTYGRVKRFLKNAFARTKFDALEQFRRLVRTQMVLIDKERTLRGGTSRQASGLHRAVGGFRYVRRTAKVKDYDEASGLHTIYYRDDEKKTRERVDLGSMTYSVQRLKHLQPRRVQRVLWSYELLTFTVTLAISLQFLAWVDWGRGEIWQIYGIAYWGQTLYNLLAFPFILMIIPGVNKLVCHAPKTGYDRDGNLKRFRKRPDFADDAWEDPNPRSRCVSACYPFTQRWRI